MTEPLVGTYVNGIGIYIRIGNSYPDTDINICSKEETDSLQRLAMLMTRLQNIENQAQDLQTRLSKLESKLQLSDSP